MRSISSIPPPAPQVHDVDIFEPELRTSKINTSPASNLTIQIHLNNTIVMTSDSNRNYPLSPTYSISPSTLPYLSPPPSPRFSPPDAQPPAPRIPGRHPKLHLSASPMYLLTRPPCSHRQSASRNTINVSVPRGSRGARQICSRGGCMHFPELSTSDWLSNYAREGRSIKDFMRFEPVYRNPLVAAYVKPKIDRRRWGGLAIERLAERQWKRMMRKESAARRAEEEWRREMEIEAESEIRLKEKTSDSVEAFAMERQNKEEQEGENMIGMEGHSNTTVLHPGSEYADIHSSVTDPDEQAIEDSGYPESEISALEEDEEGSDYYEEPNTPYLDPTATNFLQEEIDLLDLNEDPILCNYGLRIEFPVASVYMKQKMSCSEVFGAQLSEGVHVKAEDDLRDIDMSYSPMLTGRSGGGKGMGEEHEAEDGEVVNSGRHEEKVVEEKASEAILEAVVELAKGEDDVEAPGKTKVMEAVEADKKSLHIVVCSDQGTEREGSKTVPEASGTIDKNEGSDVNLGDIVEGKANRKPVATYKIHPEQNGEGEASGLKKMMADKAIEDCMDVTGTELQLAKEVSALKYAGCSF